MCLAVGGGVLSVRSCEIWPRFVFVLSLLLRCCDLSGNCTVIIG